MASAPRLHKGSQLYMIDAAEHGYTPAKDCSRQLRTALINRGLMDLDGRLTGEGREVARELFAKACAGEASVPCKVCGERVRLPYSKPYGGEVCGACRRKRGTSAFLNPTQR